MGLLAAVATATGLVVAAACSADDELFAPRPTVPTVTTPQANTDSVDMATVDGGQDGGRQAVGEEPDTERDGGQPAVGEEPDTPGEAGAEGPEGSALEPVPAPRGDGDGADEPASSTPEAAAGPASDRPGVPEAEETPEPVRPDGNMFAARISVEQVLELDEPIDMAVAAGDDLVWIAERAGRVVRVDLGRGEVVETVLDITAETEATGERGLLGIAVTDRWLYANFTDLNGDTRVDAFERSGSGLGTRRRTILSEDQPYGNHNGGDLAFGPDGFMYVAFGDGGSGGDPLDHGQNPHTWLGAILRIEPTPGGDEPYAVPSGNPYSSAGRDAEASAGGRPEIFLTGVRNPWRFSFDRATGDLWIGDVGQDRYEEVTVLLAANGGGAGANLGWRLREGLHAFEGDKPENNADPVWEYDQDDGCSVTGGYMYRGTAIEDLYGTYVFGDYCTSRLWGVQISTGEVEFRDLGAEVPGGSLASFGEDADGELYALSLNGPVSRIVPG